MPSSNDEAFHQDDTPDDVKGSKQTRKKQKKKTAKQRASDDSSKDSSSEEPRPSSPELAPTLNAPASSPDSPPPSHSPSPSLGPRSSGPDLSFSPLDKAGPPLPKPSTLLQAAHQQFRPFAVTSEPSPPQDGVMIGQDGVKPTTRLPFAASSPVQHPLSSSSSPQGGIRLPANIAPVRPYTPASAATSMPPKHHMPYPAQTHDLPPPHMPQRHFSRLAEFDFSKPAAASNNITAGSRGYYCGFDVWQAPKGSSPSGTCTAVLIGWEGGLEVYRLTRQRTEMLGRLEGLQGSVIEAKILPWTHRHDPLEHLRPLIACVVHGPVFQAQPEPTPEDSGGSPSPSAAPVIAEYRTAVEVYSMRTWRRVATLYQTRPEPIQQSVNSPGFVPPPPAGNLSIAAEGKFTIITSGTSGEVWVFAPREHMTAESQDLFCCIGKLWTSIRTRSTEVKHSNAHAEPGPARVKIAKRPVFALSQRWLAVKPPLMSSSQMTLKGSVMLSDQGDVPGVSTHASPAPPLPNCEVDAPFNDSLLSRLTKQATQEIYKGAQWFGEQGIQAFKHYVNRPTTSAGDPAYYGSPQSEQAIFPPTHAHSNEPQPSPLEPALVSLVDLDKLLEREEHKIKGAPAPLATFYLNDGCSFLSFSPNGLSILATNHVGDESRVWDLTRVADGRGAAGVPSAVGTVRMTSRFHRVSPSSVADVAWSTCASRIAILTEKGTVHLYGLQSSDSRQPLTQCSGIPSPSSSPRDDALPGGWMNNVRAGWQSIHGLAVRSRSGSSGFVSTIGNASAAARYAGGRAVRQGFSKGFGMAAEGAHNIRHAEDNKIRLRPSRQPVAPGCVRWLYGKDRDIISTMIDGKITLLAVRNVSHTQHRKTIVTPAVGKKPIAEIPLQPISNDILPPAVLGLLDDQGPHAACAKDGPHGFCIWENTGCNKQTPVAGAVNKSTAAPVQDKDTNPPYMPFHRLPQISLFTLIETSGSQAGSQAMRADNNWVFGMPLPDSTKINCQQCNAEEAYLAEGEMDGFMGKMDERFGVDIGKRASEDDRLVDM